SRPDFKAGALLPLRDSSGLSPDSFCRPLAKEQVAIIDGGSPRVSTKILPQNIHGFFNIIFAVLTVEKSIQQFAEENAAKFQTPYYLIDEARLVKNLEKIARVRNESGAKSVLALKCFSTWSVFPLLRQYMDGTTSSSLFEARLGH